jgi:hypothetical protein|tara:strand:+ start:323 stop:592 length:270 start_codon:yes stop_codon:yes gene_type:complete
MHRQVGAREDNASIRADRTERQYLAHATHQFLVIVKDSNGSTEARRKVEFIISEHHRVRGLDQATGETQSICLRQEIVPVGNPRVGLNR